MKIQINEIRLLLDLVAFLERLDVASHRLAPDTVEVRLVRPLSDQVDEAADRLTIVQTLREWCSLQPASGRTSSTSEALPELCRGHRR